MHGKPHVPTALARGKGSPARSRAGVDVFEENPARSRAGVDVFEEKNIRVRGGNLNPDGLFLFRCIITIMIIIMLQMTQNL